MDTTPEVNVKAASNDAERHARVDSSAFVSESSLSPTSGNAASPSAAAETTKQSCVDGAATAKPMDGAGEGGEPNQTDSRRAAEAEGPAVFDDLASRLVENFQNAMRDAFGKAENVLSGQFQSSRDSYFFFGLDPRVPPQSQKADEATSQSFGSNSQQEPPQLNEKADEPESLLDLTREFVPHKGDLSWMETTEIYKYRQVLSTERVLFIISPDREIARRSAWALVERMNLSEANQRQLLDFERVGERNSIPHVLDLRRPNQNQNGSNQHQEVAVVVDGVTSNVNATEFLNSFPIDTCDTVFSELERNRAFVVYLVDGADLEARLTMVVEDEPCNGTLKFSQWRLPFLRFLLKPHFADSYLELEAKIRHRADWPQDDRGLFWKVKDLIRKGLLEQSLDDQATAPDWQTSATIFTGTDTIQDTVAYVGAFFKGLNPREFQRIVPLLLGEKTRTITVPGSKQNEDGTSQKIELQKEKPLVLIWQESMDQINRQCSLITVPAPDGTRTVDFNDQRIKAQLRQYIEDEHGFFVSSQFSQLFDIGLLFDPSVRIGESMVSLTAAMVASDPEYYLQQLVNMIEQLEAGPDAMAARFPPFTIMAGLDPSQADNHIYQRIADLIRALLADPRRKGIVASLMEQLMRRKMFGPVLKIVRKLRSVSGFDEAHWLKQLFERGDSLIGDVTLFYLYGYFKSLGPRVYQLLTSLDAWIPNEPLNETPPASAREALRLLLVHCFEATARLDGKYYGASPSRHPLFAFRDRDLAESNLDLLVRWLLHPWMQSVFSDESEFKSVECLVAALTFQWTQILIGQSGSLSSKQKADATFSSNEVQQILVNQLVTRADINQQRLMVSEWQKQSRRMLHQIERAPYASEKRNDLIWRRNLLNDLITQFRNLASAKASTRTAT